MTSARRIALAAALVTVSAHAEQTMRAVGSGTLPCFSNHFILDEPCATWEPASAGLTDPDVYVIRGDATSVTTLYAGGWSGLFKSIDGGRSWTLTGLDLTVRAAADTAAAHYAFRNLPSSFEARSIVTQVAIDASRPGTVYAATRADKGAWFGQRRFFKSTDAGSSWADNLGPGIGGVDNVHSLVMAPTDPSVLYISDYDNSLGDTWSPMVRSDDGGATWKYQPEVAYVVLNVLAIDPADARTLYGGTFAFAPEYTPLPDGVLKSTDGGVTWQPSGFTGPGVSALAIAPTVPRTLYAATSSDSSPQMRNRVFMSTDGGLSWLPTDTRLGDSPLTALVVDPEDSNTVYAAAFGGGVARTVDAGATWRLLNEGLADLFVRTLLVVPGDAGALYAGTRSGVFRLAE